MMLVRMTLTRRIRSRRGLSTIEYLGLLLVIMGLLAVSGQFVRNLIQGYFRSSGEQLSYLRQHDPHRTRDCVWDDRLLVWYSEKCFEYYARSTQLGADDVTTMTCNQNLSSTSCAYQSFAHACPTSCAYAGWKQGTCHSPCAYVANP